MPTIHLLHPDGRRTTLDAPSGTTLMRAAVDANVDGIVADCGGTSPAPPVMSTSAHPGNSTCLRHRPTKTPCST